MRLDLARRTKAEGKTEPSDVCINEPICAL
jgi:hypothetical protein